MGIIILLSLLLCGCAPQQQQDPRDIHGVNPQFTSYVQEFEVQLGHAINDIPIQFASLSGNTIGECIVWNSEWREIKIDPNFWVNGASDDDTRFSLIAHELGHCQLNRGHLNTSTTLNGWPVNTSFMNAYIFFYAGYPQSESYYINELFHPAPGYPILGSSSGEDDDDFVHINAEVKHGI